MHMSRQNPDVLLKAINNESENSTRGRLKIFFGYAAGVGKTYAMLQAAHTAKEHGIDVVLGYIEPHERPQTKALVSGLEQIPSKKIKHGNIELSELDLDAVLERKPQLVLVDEFAHTDAPGMRHTKRYQDIKELLAAGIDVYTTVNVQHIESLNDTVAAITGVIVRERIPDAVFDKADQVEFVDIEPSELLDRLKSGNVYKETQADRAMYNFFTLDNLIALREIALRRCADRINIMSENVRIKNNGDFHTDEHILVCLSSSPSNAKIIRTAARMANAFKGILTALYVETPEFSAVSDEDKKRLRQNIRLAEQLGAKIETVYGDDVPYQIAEFARLSGVSKIVIGRSASVKKHFFNKPALTEKLIAHAPNMDIHIIPDSSDVVEYRKANFKKKNDFSISLRDLMKSIGILLAATLIGYAFSGLGFKEANIVTVYILAVLVIAVITTRRLYSMVSSVVSVLVFNFFFTVPKFTFMAYDDGYPVTFLIMLTVAFITSNLAIKLKNHAKQAAHAAFRTKILFDTNQLIQKASGTNEIITATANQLIKLLGKNIVIYCCEDNKLGNPHIFQANGEDSEDELTTENEKATAQWVMKNNKHAGATTDTLSGAKCMYFAIRVNSNVYGVVGIDMNDSVLDSFENSVLLSILGECAMAMENEQNAKEKEAAAILAKNEQLRANLLRAISHDLRTPLTSIMGNADNLLSNGASFDDETKHLIYKDIYDDSMWLINLVENLLSVTKLEDGKMKLNPSLELMDEIITEALHHINNKSGTHKIKTINSDEIALVNVDARLIIQVIINLVDNAIKYTPEGSEIVIKTKVCGKNVEVSVADNGYGIPDESKSKVFDMFFSGANSIADSRRSIGIGLSLCKSIVTAHGGKIFVSDNKPQGAVFTFTLPTKEVNLNE
ncbi:MAG: sensor histidine kinase KdpD [Oscillospiraceae bacterium]|nr:sensor histidine kinase KdpD [Oscillospiraceae bacterium]